MRFFRLTPAAPPHVLLVESGSRRLLEGVLPYLRRCYGEQAPVSLVTCFAGAPEGLPAGAAVYRVHEYRGREGRKRLYNQLLGSGVSVLAMICSGEPILSRWKWALALRLPVQVLVVNENGDYFWFNRSNWKTIRRLVQYRAGLSGGEAVATVGQVLLFPFTLLYLLAYAAALHLRRKVHI
jgi:hypothetical protein